MREKRTRCDSSEITVGGGIWLRRWCAHQPKPPLEGRWHAKRDGEVCRRAAAAARQRPLHRPGVCGNLSVRQHLSGAPRQLPSRGAFPLRRRSPKPLLEERWHAKRDGEVCRRAAAAARQRPLHRPKPCGKLSVRQHLSGAPRQLPSRGAFPLRRRSPKPLLEERWHAKRDGEVCRRNAAAARKRPLHRPRPCGKPSVR